MAKKKNKPVLPALYGSPLGFKHLGKPLTVAFGVFKTENIEPVWEQNSVEFEFTLLEEKPELFLWNDVTATRLKTFAQPGYSLGVFIISHPEFVVAGDGGEFVLSGELLPFKVGESRTWRNPKFGFLLEDSEEDLIVMRETAKFYGEVFPGFDAVYKVEQVIDPAGISDSISGLVDKSVERIVNS